MVAGNRGLGGDIIKRGKEVGHDVILTTMASVLARGLGQDVDRFPVPASGRSSVRAVDRADDSRLRCDAD